MAEYGVRLAGSGDLVRAIRAARAISRGSLAASEIERRIRSSELVAVWDDAARDLLTSLAERHDEIRRELASLAATGFALSFAYPGRARAIRGRTSPTSTVCSKRERSTREPASARTKPGTAEPFLAHGAAHEGAMEDVPTLYVDLRFDRELRSAGTSFRARPAILSGATQ